MSRSSPAIHASENETILEEIRKLERRIRERAHAIFVSHGGGGRDLDDWLAAEHELVWIPILEMSEKGNELLVQIAAPGLSPDDFRIEVTPTDLLIEANVNHIHGSEHGIVYLCEFKSGRMFRALHLPRKIEPSTLKADYRNGMLRLTGMIAAEEGKKTAQTKTA